MARAAYRAEKAEFREIKAIQRMNEGKIRPWALTRIDAKGNVKPLPGMTPARFQRLKRMLLRSTSNLASYKRRWNKEWRMHPEFYKKWVDFENKGDKYTYGKRARNA